MTEELSFTNGFAAITTDPQEATDLATRSDLIFILYKIIKHHHWRTDKVVGELLKDKIQKFSLSQLLGFLGHLGFTFRSQRPTNASQGGGAENRGGFSQLDLKGGQAKDVCHSTSFLNLSKLLCYTAELAREQVVLYESTPPFLRLKKIYLRDLSLPIFSPLPYNLIMNISNQLTTLPTLLQPEVNHLWQDYLTAASPEDQICLAQSSQVFETLPKVWACSPFVANHCVQNPALLSNLIISGDLLTPPHDYSHLANQLPDATNEASFMQILRHLRHREMLRIAWRDLAGWAPLTETLQSLSNLADALIAATLTKLHQRLIQQLGTPCNPHGVPQSLVVLAMGKLGGQELNFSSDIDLIFAYPETGETVGVSRPRTNQEFFTRLGQQLIHTLNHITADGFVFRVDMRLRPFGDSGPLVINFTAVEEYYQAHARDWERYALIKARVVAGDKLAGETLLTTLRPFVYRRYLDFNTFEALRTMKALIDQETSRKGLNNNIKLGPGGIREIEFTCQVFQLLRGGRQQALQQRNLLMTLAQLEQYQLLPQNAITRLREAYHFLRLTENHLQAIADQQTQTLPEDPLNQIRLAYSMNFPDWNNLIAQLLYHQQAVHTEFQQIITPRSAGLETKARWMPELHNQEQAESLLTAAGFQEAPAVFAHLQRLFDSHSINRLSKRGHERLDALIPLLLATVSECPPQDKDNAIHRTLDLIETVAQRSVYLALLIEHPHVLKQLVQLCANSAWIAEQITRYPLLLDELIDPRRLYDPLKPGELDNALQALLAHLPEDDLEMQMDSLNQFKRANVLRVAAAELSDNFTVEVASDYLAAIADTLVKRALSMAWDYLAKKHGQPYYRDQDETFPAGFCVVAYGKAGGIELSYGSDLDIIFLHDSHGLEQFTDGDKSLDNNVFFYRLTNRIIHILTTTTPAGRLYEVDSRLRPGGASGLIVSSLEAFETYQREKAWTWEHQALVRARAMAGDASCITKFAKLRRDILSRRRDPLKLKQDVCEMRTKMLINLDQSTHTKFDIKQGRGGITDIEFIVQYGVLRWAAEYPNLLDKTAMLRLLGMFVKYQLFNEIACLELRNAFRTYRAEVHRLALQNQPALVEQDKFSEHRQNVKHWWQEIMAEIMNNE
jgi:glutamate-ammonia-ligase adenylyltransferase